MPEQAAPAEYRAPFLSKLPKSSRIKFGQGTGNGACIARGRAVYNGIVQNGGASAPGAGNRNRPAAGGYPLSSVFHTEDRNAVCKRKL